jgi:hypothetical protein
MRLVLKALVPMAWAIYLIRAPMAAAATCTLVPTADSTVSFAKGTVASRPALTLEAVAIPEPATSVLAISTLVVMIGVLTRSQREARNDRVVL